MYAFSGNDPINGSDPYGTLPRDCVYTVEITYVIATGRIIDEEIIGVYCPTDDQIRHGGGGTHASSKKKTPPSTCLGPAVAENASLLHNIGKSLDFRYDDIWFYQTVKGKAAWDYRSRNPAFEDFGNFNYGATGKAAGFRDIILLRMAGYAHQRAKGASFFGAFSQAFLGGAPFGDDPHDQLQIQRGINYFEAFIRGRCR